MRTTPRWLTTLQRVRELRRDAAAQELANRQKTLLRIEAEQRDMDAVIDSLVELQRSEITQCQVMPERLRDILNARRSLMEQRSQLVHQARTARTALRDAQTQLAGRVSEVQSLERLIERFQTRQARFQHQENDQAQRESILRLCNQRRSD